MFSLGRKVGSALPEGEGGSVAAAVCGGYSGCAGVGNGIDRSTLGLSCRKTETAFGSAHGTRVMRGRPTEEERKADR